MSKYYVQLTNSVATTVCELSGEVISVNLILIPKMEMDLLGSTYINGDFLKPTKDEEGNIIETKKFNLETGEWELI
jgi:hypothetical protein